MLCACCTYVQLPSPLSAMLLLPDRRGAVLCCSDVNCLSPSVCKVSNADQFDGGLSQPQHVNLHVAEHPPDTSAGVSGRKRKRRRQSNQQELDAKHPGNARHRLIICQLEAFWQLLEAWFASEDACAVQAWQCLVSQGPPTPQQTVNWIMLHEMKAVLHPKLHLPALPGMAPSATNLFGTIIENPHDEDIIAVAHETPVKLPRQCRFLMCDVGKLQPLLREGTKYQLIVMDPPWENASVKRGSKYQTMPARGLLSLPIPQLLDQSQGLVAMWITNRERLHRFVEQELLAAWGLQLAATWYWLKVKPVAADHPAGAMPLSSTTAVAQQPGMQAQQGMGDLRLLHQSATTITTTTVSHRALQDCVANPQTGGLAGLSDVEDGHASPTKSSKGEQGPSISTANYCSGTLQSEPLSAYEAAAAAAAMAAAAEVAEEVAAEEAATVGQAHEPLHPNVAAACVGNVEEGTAHAGMQTSATSPTCPVVPVLPLDCMHRHPYEILLLLCPLASTEMPGTSTAAACAPSAMSADVNATEDMSTAGIQSSDVHATKGTQSATQCTALTPLIMDLPDGFVFASKPSAHSRKPKLRGLLEFLNKGVCFQNCLEMFARDLQPGPGWTSCGNEVLFYQEV